MNTAACKTRISLVEASVWTDQRGARGRSFAAHSSVAVCTCWKRLVLSLSTAVETTFRRTEVGAVRNARVENKQNNNKKNHADRPRLKKSDVLCLRQPTDRCKSASHWTGSGHVGLVVRLTSVLTRQIAFWPESRVHSVLRGGGTRRSFGTPLSSALPGVFLAFTL